MLLVDDDQQMLLALRGGLSRYRDSFGIQLAAGGLQAVEKLKQNVIILEAARRKDEDIAEATPPSVLEEVAPFDGDPKAYLKSIKEGKYFKDIGRPADR